MEVILSHYYKKAQSIILSFLFIIVVVTNVNLATDFKAKPFELNQVKLLDSMFKDAMERNGAYLLELEPDRLLSDYLQEAGLSPKGARYGGWEESGLNGHSLGHYLSACAMMYQATVNERFLERVNYIIDELEQVQLANGNGYVGAVPNGLNIFNEISQGIINVPDGFNLNGGWVPWYNIHKAYAGVRDAYLYCDNEKAKQILIGMTDWADDFTKTLTNDQMQEMLACEQGGMYEIFADVYELTGETKYLDLAKRFYHEIIMDPLANEIDQLGGIHANTQIPKVIGAARIYELTEDEKNKTIAEFFWDRVVNHHSYANGGNSEYESFCGSDMIAASMRTGHLSETCNTYNMLKLTEHMFAWHAEEEKMDFYERALYNHILMSINPENGCTSYKYGLYGPYYQCYGSKTNSFWCCTGSGMENHTKYGKAIYYHDDDGLFVNLFIPSVLTWEEKDVNVTMNTNFPDDDIIHLTINTGSSVNMPIYFRYPGWAKQGMTIKINGEEFSYQNQPGSYVTINRTWQNGDKIDVQIPMSVRIDKTPDNKERVAFMYGPVLLAGIFEGSGPSGGFYGSQRGERASGVTIPTLSNIYRPFSEWIEAVPDTDCTFRIFNMGYENDIALVPIFRTHFKVYTAYWDAYDSIPEEQSEPIWTGEHYTFDGTDDYITLSDNITLEMVDFTILTKVLVKSNNAWQRIFDFGNSVSMNMFLTPISGYNDMRFCITTDGAEAEQQLIYNTPLSLNTWHSIIVRLKGNQGTLFLDGEKVAENSSMDVDPIMFGPTSNNWLGRSQYPADPYFEGEISDFRIYNRALSDSEIEVVLDVEEDNSSPEKDFRLENNYPNPFNSQTLIHYVLPKQEHVVLTVYDMLGKEIKVLINEVKEPGQYTATFDAQNISSGIYFYKLQAGAFSEAKKFVLLR